MDDDVLDEVFDPTLAGALSEHVIEDPKTCTNCGRQLGFSTDDQPYWPTGPMCGDCYQARQMDDEIDWSDAQDGT